MPERIAGTAKRSWRLLQWAILAVVVYAIASSFDWHQVIASCARARAVYLIPVVLILTPLSVVLRSLRWRGLVPGGNQVSLTRYVRAYLTGFLANSLLPGKLGDLLKARVICQPGIEYGSSLASALADRVLEGVALLLVLAAADLNGELPSWAQHVALWAGGASLAASLGMGFLFQYRQALSCALARALIFLPRRQRDRVAPALLNLFVGFESLTSRPRVLRALFYSLAIWVVEIVAVVTFLAAFAIPAPWFLAALLVLVALNFGTLVPISPGSIGVYQLLCVFALALWHVDRDLSFSMGLNMQAVLFLPVYAAGLVCLLASRKEANEAEKLSSQELVIGKAGH